MSEEGFASPEEREDAEKLARLESVAHQGALFEDWMRHQAGQMFSKYLEGQIIDAKNQWLGATDRDAAEVVRIQAQVYQKISQWIKANIAQGKVAALEVKKYHEEGVQLEGWIKNQSSQVRPE